MKKIKFSRLFIKYNPFIVISLFCFLYYPPMLIGNLIHIIGIISIIYVILKRQRWFTSLEFRYVLFYVIVFSYLVVSIGLINNNNLSACATPVIFVVDFLPFCIFLTDYFKKCHLVFDDLIAVLLFVAVIQGITAVASFISPEIHMYFINSIVRNSGLELYYSLSAYRMYGFSTGLNFITPCLQGFFAVIALLYSLDHSKLYILFAVIMLFSSIINARASLLVMGVGFVLLILMSGLKRKQKFWVITGLVCVVGIATLVLLPYIRENINHTFLFIIAGFNQLTDFFLKGKRDTGYFAYITSAQHYRLPDKFLNILFGKGSFVMSQNSFGYQSDVGFINDIWFGGVIYVAIYYTGTFVRLLLLRKSKEKIISFIALFLIFCFLILNFKGIVFSLNGFMSLTLILYLFSAKMGYIKTKFKMARSNQNIGER